MKVSYTGNSTVVITLDAFLNAESEDDLLKHLAEASQNGNDKVILDFRSVDHINPYLLIR